MSFKQLYIFVEGPDDKRFFESIFFPFFDQVFNTVKAIPYRQLKKEIVIKYIETFNSQPSSDYIFIGDMDARGNPLCITRRKEIINEQYKNKINDSKLFIIKEEIESWYAAIAGNEFCNEKKLTFPSLSDSLTKEEFERKVPKDYTSNTFMVEIIKNADIEKAKKMNTSFAYFCNKFL